MKQVNGKSLEDYPGFVECRNTVARAEAELRGIIKRKDEIQTTLMSLKRPADEDEWAQFKQGGAGEILGSVSEVELRQEYADL
jgi:hypothetical protein